MSVAYSADSAPSGLKTPPPFRGGLPFIGHTVDFIRDTTGLLARAEAAEGEVVSIPIFGKNVVLVTSPEGHEEVFRKPDEVLSPKAAYKMMVPVFGKGVAYDCEDERMNEQLRMLRPALQNKRMRTYGDIIAREVNQSVDAWGEQGMIDVYNYMTELTCFTSSHCLLGPEFREEMSAEFGRVYHDLERGIIPLGYINANLPIPAFRNRDRARARLGEMVSEIVERRRKSGAVGEDFLQTLMESTYKDGSSLSDHEITGMLVAAMFAGHHTSSVTAAWTLLELLQNPEWMKRVMGELDRVYADGREVDFASIRELKVTEWVIMETLRLHPPLFILFRVAMEDTSIRGYAIPKGTWVAVSPLVAHQVEQVWPQSQSFCPHRFDAGSEEQLAPDHPYAFIAFGGGRHKCLGNAFAILQIKTVVAMLLQRYRFELIGDPIETDFKGVVLGPKSPCRIRYYEKRKR